jgi:sirohydrochlorin cobaltochelatase
MHAIILFSHGSTLCGAGENLREIASRMAARGDAPIVEVGYLNYSEPLFEEAFARCVQRGATHITIAPYFLVAGYFVQSCLPPKIAAMSARYPHVSVRVAGALKDHHLLADALLACAARPLPPERWRDAWVKATKNCRSNALCPRHGEGCLPLTVPPVRAMPHSLAEPTALLVLVHGSPSAASNNDMFKVVQLARENGPYPIVQVGFMECNEPDIPTAVEECCDRGARSVIAVPYFLHTGKHVAGDLPALLDEARARYPQIEFVMGDYVGHDPLLAEALAQRVALA